MLLVTIIMNILLCKLSVIMVLASLLYHLFFKESFVYSKCRSINGSFIYFGLSLLYKSVPVQKC